MTTTNNNNVPNYMYILLAGALLLAAFAMAVGRGMINLGAN